VSAHHESDERERPFSPVEETTVTTNRTSRYPRSRWIRLLALCGLVLLVAACGDDATEPDAVGSTTSPTPTTEAATSPEASPTTEPEPTPPGQPSPAPTPTPAGAEEEPEATEEADPSPEPSPTTEPQPADDVDLAPEIAALTGWLNGEPVTLSDLRGQPVILVFWNSI
jgi:outer membrane biosynthesis protein TonB